KVPAEKPRASAAIRRAASGASRPIPRAKRAIPSGIIRAKPRFTRWAVGRRAPPPSIRLTIVRASAGLCTTVATKTPHDRGPGPAPGGEGGRRGGGGGAAAERGGGGQPEGGGPPGEGRPRLDGVVIVAGVGLGCDGLVTVVGEEALEEEEGEQAGGHPGERG